MNRTLLPVLTLLAMTAAACSQETQENAAQTADLAGDDIEANAAVAGEVLEDGAKKAAGAVAEGAADLEQRLEEGDKEEPGPAPVTGANLNSDKR